MSATNAILLIIGALLWEFIRLTRMALIELIKVKRMLKTMKNQKLYIKFGD